MEILTHRSRRPRIRLTRIPAAARSLALLAFAALALAADPSPAGAQEVAGEYDLKAAFLVNFARLVEWPPGTFAAADEPLVIGVLADPEVGEIVDRRASGARVGDRSVRVEQIESPGDAGSCHLVFLPRSHRNLTPALVAATRGAPVLPVGESDGFAREGGLIGFFTRERKVRFEINRVAAESAGFRISSRLLDLAVIVSPDEASP